MSNVDHVNVKLFARTPVTVNWPDLIPVFHRWIQKQLFPETFPIDVADYSHVPAGPGVMLIGHHATVSVDNRENRIGFLYNRRTTFDGNFTDKVRHSYEGAIAGARQLEREPEFRGLISFDESEIELFVNDRLLAPNTPETWNSLRPDLETLFGPGAAVEWNGPSRDLFRVRVRTPVASATIY